MQNSLASSKSCALPLAGSVTARQSSSGREPNLRRRAQVSSYIRQGDHHVGHRPTFYSFFFFPCLFSAVADWMSTIFHTWCGLSASLGCRSPSHTFVRLSSQLRHVSTIEKHLLNSHTCPYTTVNFDPLAAEIGSLVWDTPANFNGFRVLASLLQQRRSSEANQTARCLAVYWAGNTFSGALAR